MGWFNASVSTNYEKTNQNESGYGTRTPIVSGDYTDAFNTMRGLINRNGYTSDQQGAVDFTGNYLYNRGGAAGRIAPVNSDLTAIRSGLDRFTSGTPNLLGAAPQASVSTIAGVDPITAERVKATTGAEFRSAYLDPYLNDVVDSSLASYDQGAAEARNSLRAANAGAFGNKRFGVAEGQFAADSALGRGQLVSGLRSDAFRFSTDAGMRDSDRRATTDIANQDASLRAATANADNVLRTQTFNAGAQNAASIYNTGIQNERDIADLGSRNTADARAITALTEQAGITKGIADNIFKADGIDLDAAQNLFAAGTISQGQLKTILDAAAAYNGSSYTDNRSGNRSTYSIGAEVGF